MVDLESLSPDETEALGERLAPHLRSGDVITLHGEMGAGKTTLVRGLARGLACPGPVSSPTFVLMNLYQGPLPLRHLDAWRLGGPEDLEAIGFEELLSEPGITVLEWPDRAEGLLPEDHLEIHLAQAGAPDRRRVQLVALGARAAEILGALR